MALLLSLGAGALRAQTGRLVADTVPAPSLAGNLLGDPTEQPAFVYLPPGYDAEPDRRYATVYLLHGILDEPEVWTEGAYDGMKIQAVMDSLIAAGEIRPMIVVVPNGMNGYGGSMYMNSSVGGGWGDWIGRDLVSHVDATYRTIPAAASRALVGHSMGGFGALRLAMLHPDVFSVAWGMNPCCLCCLGGELPAQAPVWRLLPTLDSREALWRRLTENRDAWPLIIASTAAAFGPDPERPPLFFEAPYRIEGDSAVLTGALERWESALPVAQAAAHADALRSLRGYAFDTAFSDEFRHIPAATKAFSDTLEALRVPHLYEVYEGDHRNQMDERLPGRVLPWVDAWLEHAAD